MSQKYTNNITATTTPTTIPLESPHHYPHTQGLSLKTKTTVNYMYLYTLTTSFYLFSQKFIYILPTKTYRLNI